MQVYYGRRHLTLASTVSPPSSYEGQAAGQAVSLLRHYCRATSELCCFLVCDVRTAVTTEQGAADVDGLQVLYTKVQYSLSTCKYTGITVIVRAYSHMYCTYCKHAISIDLRVHVSLQYHNCPSLLAPITSCWCCTIPGCGGGLRVRGHGAAFYCGAPCKRLRQLVCSSLYR